MKRSLHHHPPGFVTAKHVGELSASTTALVTKKVTWCALARQQFTPYCLLIKIEGHRKQTNLPNFNPYFRYIDVPSQFSRSPLQIQQSAVKNLFRPRNGRKQRDMNAEKLPHNGQTIFATTNNPIDDAHAHILPSKLLPCCTNELGCSFYILAPT
jgi:hypothetical protein